AADPRDAADAEGAAESTGSAASPLAAATRERWVLSRSRQANNKPSTKTHHAARRGPSSRRRRVPTELPLRRSSEAIAPVSYPREPGARGGAEPTCRPAGCAGGSSSDTT